MLKNLIYNTGVNFRRLSLVELSEEFLHVGHHLLWALHTRKVTTEVAFCNDCQRFVRHQNNNLEYDTSVKERHTFEETQIRRCRFRTSLWHRDCESDFPLPR